MEPDGEGYRITPSGLGPRLRRERGHASRGCRRRLPPTRRLLDLPGYRGRVDRRRYAACDPHGLTPASGALEPCMYATARRSLTAPSTRRSPRVCEPWPRSPRGVEPAVDVVDATAPSRRSSMPLTRFASRQPAPPPERLSGLSVPSEAYDRGMTTTTTTTTTTRSEESSDAR